MEAPLSDERRKENPAIIGLRQVVGRVFRLTGRFRFSAGPLAGFGDSRRRTNRGCIESLQVSSPIGVVARPIV